MSRTAIPRSPLTDARRDLVAANVPLARWEAGRHRGDYQANLDAAVDGLIRAATLYDPARGPKFSAFAVHCMRSAISDAAKASRRARRCPSGAVLSLDHEAAAAIEPGAPGAYLGDSFADLTRPLGVRERKILALRFRDGLTHAEIAERLGISRSGAERIQARALARLREVS